MSKVCLSLEWFFGNIIVIFKFVWILKRLDKNLWERAVMLAPYLRMLILVYMETVTPYCLLPNL